MAFKINQQTFAMPDEKHHVTAEVSQDGQVLTIAAGSKERAYALNYELIDREASSRTEEDKIIVKGDQDVFMIISRLEFENLMSTERANELRKGISKRQSPPYLTRSEREPARTDWVEETERMRIAYGDEQRTR